MARKIYLVGFRDLHSEATQFAFSHDHEVALDGADVVAFRLPQPPWAAQTHQGKPSLNDDQSFHFRDLLDRWRHELVNALGAGKTVFVELTRPAVVFVATGTVERSGTGRNAQQIRHVGELSNHAALPVQLPDVVIGRGLDLRIAPRAEFFSAYWSQFGEASYYELRFTPKEGWRPLLVTNAGATTAALVPAKAGGKLILMPPAGLNRPEYDDYFDEDVGEEDPEHAAAWQAADDLWRQRSLEFVTALFDMDRALSRGGAGPPPAWASSYSTTLIDELTGKLNEVGTREIALQAEQEELDQQMADARVLQSLLYANGRDLEVAVLRALHLMGIDAQQYEEGGSEFDAVFEIDGQRMLGEVEGRDNSPIAIGKITQLERNVAEDFERDEVDAYAKGVLFGNPQRLVAPGDRTVDFTDKCLQSADRNKFALVLTTSMFEPATYLEGTPDPDYASTCRNALLATAGAIVEFPPPPDIAAEA